MYTTDLVYVERVIFIYGVLMTKILHDSPFHEK